MSISRKFDMLAQILWLCPIAGKLLGWPKPKGGVTLPRDEEHSGTKNP